MSPTTGRMLKENNETINRADILEAIYNALIVDKDVDVSLAGNLINHSKNLVVTANTNILAENHTPAKTQKSILMVLTNTAGVLSLLVDGVAGVLNSGNPVPANQWWACEIPLIANVPYNLQLSSAATIQLNWGGM